MKDRKKSAPVQESKCCSCMACVAACPADCISTEINSQGFPRPVIDETRCLKCGKCKQVCPARHPFAQPRLPQKTFALKILDHDVWKKSSSGGAFSLLAEKTLSEGGVVFGAAFDATNKVEQRFVENVEDLDCLRRSKYVWSDPGDSFRQCRNFLRKGRKVLYCGTPCLISGLENFLGCDMPNLTTVDFICHGTPSPKAFSDWLEAFARREGATASELKNINFREKAYLDAVPYSFSCEIGDRKLVEPASQNVFLRGFARDLFLNSSCYRCPVKRFRSGSDYTLADFWGAHLLYPNEIAKTDRFSLVHVFSDKENLESSVCKTAEIRHVDPWKAWKFNVSWKRSPFIHPNRRRFFNDCERIDIIENILKNCPLPLWMRILKKIDALRCGILDRMAKLWRRGA